MKKSGKTEKNASIVSISNIAFRLMCNLEREGKVLDENQKRWQSDLVSITQAIEQIKKDRTNLKPMELKHRFEEANKLLTTLTTELNELQQKINGFQKEMQTKVQTCLPLAKPNKKSPTKKAEAEGYLNKFDAALPAIQKKIEEITKTAQINQQELTTLSDAVHKGSFKEELEELQKRFEVLAKKEKTLCEQTLHFLKTPNPPQYDPKSVQVVMGSLFTLHKKNGDLLQQICLQTTPIQVPTSNDGKNDTKVNK